MGTVLFVCVENSFRSKIAEAYFNKYAPEGWIAISAGTMPAMSVHPNVVKLMAEEGIEISNHRPRLLTKELQEQSDLAVIVCSGTSCPVVYSRKIETWNIPDPSDMSIDEARKIKEIIKKKVLELINNLNKKLNIK